MLPPVVRQGGLELGTIYSLFPNLKERARSPGTKLSGGEQQMLAIARILRTGAKLLLLDEPTEGLAPVIVQQIGRTIREIKSRGFTVLLVEQNFRFAQTVADRPLCDGARARRGHGPQRRTRRVHGAPARVSRRLTPRTRDGRQAMTTRTPDPDQSRWCRRARRPALAQRPRPGEEHHPHRLVVRLLGHLPRRDRPDRTGLRAPGRRGVRQPRLQHRDHLRRQPEQGRCRVQSHARLDRPGRCGRDRGWGRVVGRAGGQRHRAREEQGLPEQLLGGRRTSPARPARPTRCIGPTTPGCWRTPPAPRR